MAHTISLAIPEPVVAYIDARVAAGEYGNRSEYIRDLVRRDQRERAKERLRALVEEGLSSGPGVAPSEAAWGELEAIARGDLP